MGRSVPEGHALGQLARPPPRLGLNHKLSTEPLVQKRKTPTLRTPCHDMLDPCWHSALAEEGEERCSPGVRAHFLPTETGAGAAAPGRVVVYPQSRTER